MPLTIPQASTLLSLVTCGAKIGAVRVHPFSGAATLIGDDENGRLTLYIVNVNGQVTYDRNSK